MSSIGSLLRRAQPLETDMKLSDVKETATPVVGDKTMAAKETKAAEAAATEETTEETAPGLSLQDLSSVLKIIDICSERGSFKGSELEAVGALRGRLQAFVAANAPTEETEEESSNE